MARGPSRIAGHDHDLAGARAGRVHGEMVPGLERDVRPVEGGGLAVLAHVGPVEGEVAGMAGPAPVVGLAAEVADRRRGRVDEPDVLQLDLGDLEPPEPLEEGRHAAAEPLLLAGGGELLLPLLDGELSIEVGLPGGELADHVLRHLPDGDGDEDAGPRPGPGLVRQRGGQEALLHGVPLRRGVVLERAGDAVVVGDDEAGVGHEGSAAASERDDGAHGHAGEVGEGPGVALEAQLLQPGGQVDHLLGHPHPAVGAGGHGGEGDGKERDRCGNSRQGGLRTASEAPYKPRIRAEGEAPGAVGPAIRCASASRPRGRPPRDRRPGRRGPGPARQPRPGRPPGPRPRGSGSLRSPGGARPPRPSTAPASWPLRLRPPRGEGTPPMRPPPEALRAARASGGPRGREGGPGAPPPGPGRPARRAALPSGRSPNRRSARDRAAWPPPAAKGRAEGSPVRARPRRPRPRQGWLRRQEG